MEDEALPFARNGNNTNRSEIGLFIKDTPTNSHWIEWIPTVTMNQIIVAGSQNKNNASTKEQAIW